MRAQRARSVAPRAGQHKQGATRRKNLRDTPDESARRAIDRPSLTTFFATWRHVPTPHALRARNRSLSFNIPQFGAARH
ncbi:hypothetical protein A2U01_0067316 [Trifolium medium]|uniref:Uncharacterized protein n=1 Tax=Trifolium medium TaxID=97028 RepID=A0A392SDZ4_9FABA|nr:hypothetical protein [Trifolium medium]